jgi:hypothetical protein
VSDPILPDHAGSSARERDVSDELALLKVGDWSAHKATRASGRRLAQAQQRFA